MNHLLTIDPALIDWSRAQFALTAIYHWLFVPLTLGLAVVMGIMETIYYRTGKPFWRELSQFWQRLFGVNFAMGVATGIILEFEFSAGWFWLIGHLIELQYQENSFFAFITQSFVVFFRIMTSFTVQY